MCVTCSSHSTVLCPYSSQRKGTVQPQAPHTSELADSASVLTATPPLSLVCLVPCSRGFAGLSSPRKPVHRRRQQVSTIQHSRPFPGMQSLCRSPVWGWLKKIHTILLLLFLR